MPKILSLGGFSGGTVPNNTTFSGNVQIDGTLGVTGVATFTAAAVATGGITSAAQAGFVLNPFNTGAGQTGELRFKELAAGGVAYTGSKAPDAITTGGVYTLPAEYLGGTYVLQSTTAGVMS